jgi:hypothetical protein
MTKPMKIMKQVREMFERLKTIFFLVSSENVLIRNMYIKTNSKEKKADKTISATTE